MDARATSLAPWAATTGEGLGVVTIAGAAGGSGGADGGRCPFGSSLASTSRRSFEARAGVAWLAPFRFFAAAFSRGPLAGAAVLRREGGVSAAGSLIFSEREFFGFIRKSSPRRWAPGFLCCPKDYGVNVGDATANLARESHSGHLERKHRLPQAGSRYLLWEG